MLEACPPRFDDEDFRALGLLPPVVRTCGAVVPATVSDALDEAVCNHPNREALIDRYRRFIFSELDAEIDAAAAALVSLGAQPGDRIAATGQNATNLVVAFHAVQRVGAIWVGIGKPLKAADKAAQLRDCGVSLYLADADAMAELTPLRDTLPDLRHIVGIDPTTGDWSRVLADHAGRDFPRPSIDPFAPALISYTSGTTGRPKGTVHSQYNLVVATRSPISGVARLGCALAMTTGNIMINHGLGALRHGQALICMDRLDAQGVLEWVAAEAIDGFRVPPPILYDLLTKPDYAAVDLSGLLYLATAGAPPSARLRELFEARMGRPLVNAYGLTEAPGVVTELDPRDGWQEGMIGRPLPHLDVGILDDQDREVAPGETGEIAVRAIQHGEWAGAYTPMLGYWKQPEVTAQALAGGWLHTGDMGFRDERGCYYVNGRRSEMILRGGTNIYPAEVERELQGDTRIRETVVVGIPDERLGETVGCAVEYVFGSDAVQLETDLRAIATAALPRYKRPAVWFVAPALPRNHMGKINRKEVRQLLLEVLNAERDESSYN